MYEIIFMQNDSNEGEEMKYLKRTDLIINLLRMGWINWSSS